MNNPTPKPWKVNFLHTDPHRSAIYDLYPDGTVIFPSFLIFDTVRIFNEKGNVVKFLFYNTYANAENERLNPTVNALFTDEYLKVYGPAVVLSNKHFTSSVQMSSSSTEKSKKRKPEQNEQPKEQ